MDKKLAEALGAYNDSGMLKITKMIPILPEQGMNRSLKKLLDESSFWKSVFKGTAYENPDLDEEDEDYDYLVESFLEEITWKYQGKLLCFMETPVMEDNMFSWGYTRLNVVMVDNLAEALNVGLKWVEEERPKKKKKKTKKRST